jgi:LmbE family N-acetylglucosaminyl deacetylase
MMKIVVLCAHPDDVVIGAGGYIAKLAAEEEAEITFVFASDGLLHAPKYDDLRDQAVEASEILGVTDVRWLNLANQRFDTYAQIDINKRFEALDLEPGLLITNSPTQLNKDHRIIYETARVYARPKAHKRMNLICFESTVWRVGGFEPNLFIDISATLDKKIKAMKAYITECRPWPHPRSPEAIRARAQYWGLHAGYHAAEPFKVVQLYGDISSISA